MSALALLGGGESEKQAISHLAALRRGGRRRFEAGAGESDLVADAGDQDTGVRTGICKISRGQARDRGHERNCSPGGDDGGPGHRHHEVILPDFTFVATASAVLFANALPVLVDVDPETYCINPDLVEEAITPRTKAVIAVHMGGHPADLDRLKRITDRKKLAVIEDSSHAHASEWKGKRIGTFGVAGTFSFQSSKLMTAGEGGMIISNDDHFERQARSVHDCGRMPGEWFYSHFIYGSNYRLSEWQGAVLNVQLGRLDEQTKHRHKNARLLDKLLSQVPGITPQKLDPRCTRNGQYAYIFHVNSKDFAGISTEQFVSAMDAEGIPNQAPKPPLHELHMFRNGEYRKRLAGAQSTEDHAFLRQKFPHNPRAALATG